MIVLVKVSPEVRNMLATRNSFPGDILNLFLNGTQAVH